MRLAERYEEARIELAKWSIQHGDVSRAAFFSGALAALSEIMRAADAPAARARAALEMIEEAGLYFAQDEDSTFRERLISEFEALRERL